MKLLFLSAAALSLFLTGLVGLNSAPKMPSVASLRGFEEPLIPLGGGTSANTDSALVDAIKTHKARKSYEDVSALTAYLDANPNSPWKFSLLANMGNIYRQTGHFSKAIDAWEQAWALGKGEKRDVKVQALANQVAADLATLLSSLGRTERLESLLKETKGRTLYGSAAVLLNYAKENLWEMKNKPGDSFKCGPLALDSIRTFANKNDASDPLIVKAQSSTKGFSLVQVRDLSKQLKMNYQMAKRQPGADFIIPSVMHWKSGHYAALLKKQGNMYLTKDPTFGQEDLVSDQALEDESSGYYLVPPGPLPKGWQTISEAEGKSVWGRGVATGRQTGATTPHDCKTCHPPSKGMAVYSIFLMLCSLSVEDTPVGYHPPVGPDVECTVTYNELEATQPSNLTFFNFGAKWNCSWLSYVNLPTSAASAAVNTRGGGQETYTETTGTPVTDSRGFVNYYASQIQGQATLWVKGTGTSVVYERRLPDGSKEVFSEVDPGVRVFLTAIVDPQGNTVTFQYYSDGSYRLHYVIDANQSKVTRTRAVWKK